VAEYEAAAGSSAAWIYFSNNWYRSRLFPYKTAKWIRREGKVPFIRIMTRSSPDEADTPKEQTFLLSNILAGKFDADFHAWGEAAKAFGTPVILDWGVEMNGQWFPWNGRWNGGGTTNGYGNKHRADGPERFVDAYRRIVGLIRDAGATNVTFVWHVNDGDDPSTPWNRLENYYPGDAYVDWIGISDYGALTPMDGAVDSFRTGMDDTYARVAALAPSKPVIVAEFGETTRDPQSDPGAWTSAALADLTSRRWKNLIGFSWWNETWQNDNNPAHDTDMQIQDDPGLTAAFRGLDLNGIQQTAVIA
jgi:hypothetical protein